MPDVLNHAAPAVAQGRATKQANAITAVLCGGVPAVILGFLVPGSVWTWMVGFLAGLFWANAFEYLYHRFLLHIPGTDFARRHLEHHSSVGTPEEPEHINLGGSPRAIALLFLVNGTPVVLADSLLRIGFAAPMLAAFLAYLLGVEEIHWRIHMREWLPPGLRFARARHIAHHDTPDVNFNVFLPFFDWLVGPRR